MTRGGLADVVASLRSRAIGAWRHSTASHQPSREQHPSDDHHPAGDHHSTDFVPCAVATCPQCECQRPYRVSREEFGAGNLPHWFEQGIELHLEIRHDFDDEDREEVIDTIVAGAELRDVPREVLDDVESQTRKWNEYGL